MGAKWVALLTAAATNPLHQCVLCSRWGATACILPLRGCSCIWTGAAGALLLETCAIATEAICECRPSARTCN